MAFHLLLIAKRFLFYTIFYLCLAAFCALNYKLFSLTLDDDAPKWKLNSSLIGSNPGMSYRPLLYPTNVIEYKAGDSKFADLWTNELNKFLEPYFRVYKHENVQSCHLLQKPESGKVCDFKILASQFAPCFPGYAYGFDFDGSEKGPCVFLKMNKIYGWQPEFYNRDTVPSDMPLEIVEKIKNAELRNEQEKIWVDCRGLESSDEANVGSIKYYPEQGFEGRYFPYTNIEGYLNPLVAVHFEKPKRGVLINIECRAWAANIYHDHKDNKGLITFTLLVH